MKPGDIWYRATISVWHRIDAAPSVSLYVTEVTILRTTDEGAWVREAQRGEEKWVTPRTHWCSPSKEAAIENLRIRKARHVGHARRRLEDAELAFAYLGGEAPEVAQLAVKGLVFKD